ncbi:MAG: nitrilase-related carbon-nitrogen hydrolase [Imperialibacter sp.]|uniref:nitrilase-related carbon-nitrogen hydrolase n=1 Tax=Imperialibacter sp. TaxID=2038411 RepID=UPI0032EA920F
MIKGRNLLVSAVLVFLVLCGAYYWWIQSGRSYAEFEMTSERSVFIKAGTYTMGNIVGIQPYMVPADYRSADALYAKLNRYLSIAKKNGCFTSATVVVFPEYIGTWLVAINEKASVYTAETTEDALSTAAFSHPISFLANYFASDAKGRATEALFSLKAVEMAEAYQRVFSRLAAEYRATVVAGSIILPSPSIEAGVLQAGNGPLFNVSATFDATGMLAGPLTVKNFLTSEEKAFTVAGNSGQLPIVGTPAGNVATLICADSWYGDVYRVIADMNVDFVVVPSYLAGEKVWNQPWKGYNGAQPPANVSPDDIGTLTEGQAWQKYGMLGRAPEFGIQTGLNIFLRGQLWDLSTDGNPLVLSEGKPEMIEIPADGAAIVNLQF